MTPLRDAFLNLLAAALGNAHAPVPELTADQWRELFALAAEHKVLPLIFGPAYPQVARLDPALAAGVKRQVRLQVVAQTIRTAEFLELYRALEEAGATPLVVKGIVCRQLYAKPDHRPSADEDVLIPPEQFDECHRIFTDFGMQTAMSPEEMSDAYEVPYTKAGSPLYIELHKQLFAPGSEAYGHMNRFFERVH